MRICPTCNEVYKDDDINFCLADGTTLLKKKNANAQQTLKFALFGRIEAWMTKRRKSRAADITAARMRLEKRKAACEKIDEIFEDIHEINSKLSEEEVAEKERLEIFNVDRARIREIRERIFELKGYVLDKVRLVSSTNGITDIDSMDGLDFEHFVADLLNRRGYHAEVTKGSGDMGVDILATNHDKRFAVQVKRYNQPISRRAISDAVTGKNFYGCDGAMVITNNYFTKDAHSLAAASDCLLVDRDELFQWMSLNTSDIATFQARLQEEIRNLQNLPTFAFWGEDVVFEASRELTVDYRLNFQESSFKKFAEVNTWLDPGSEPDSEYQLPHPSLITQNSGGGSFRALVESEEFKEAYSYSTFGFGDARSGSIVTASLDELGHIFIAGSIDGHQPAGLQTILASLLFKATPNDIVISISETRGVNLTFDFRQIADEGGLGWLRSNEIEKRYYALAKRGVKDFREYNLEAIRRKRCKSNYEYGDEPWAEFRSIVVILYDFADVQTEIDPLLRDIVQRGSGVGIHLILATLRPTPATVKRVNWLGIPTRIVSHLPAPFDSRGILDNQPLFPNGQNEMLVRFTGSLDVFSGFEPRLAHEDLQIVLDYVREQGFRGLSGVNGEELDDGGDLPGRRDPLFMDALKCIVQAKRGSTSLLQRHLRIGYGRAAAILDAMVREGYIGEQDSSTRARPVLAKAYEDLQDINEGALGDE